MTNDKKKESTAIHSKKNRIPRLEKGVYLIEEEYQGVTHYVVYIRGSKFGFQLTEPLFQFLMYCSPGTYRLGEIIEKMLTDFAVEPAVLEHDLANELVRLEKMKIITYRYHETLPE